MIKKLNIEHLTTIEKYEKHFSSLQIKQMLQNPNYFNIAYFLHDKIVCYCFCANNEQTLDIIFIRTINDYQRQHYASQLLSYLFEQFPKASFMVEVNENNYVAIDLYNKFAFKKISMRKDYYGTNQNAIIMKR